MPLTHGCCYTKTYKSWVTMRQRCNNKNHHHYKNYGGRGIRVCRRWGKFENFLSDMGHRPEDRTIDRIDNDGNYEPSNCRWATILEQSRNKQRPKISVVNTSGIVGVRLNNRKNRWLACIGINGKIINLGAFIKKECAINARREAEIKYW